jgi:protein phosphatase
MPDEQLSRLPRNVITRALGMTDSVRVSVRSWELAAGDRFVLCSDGLTDRIQGYEMVDALELASNPEEQARLLLELAKEGPADDNVAAIVVSCDLPPGASDSPRREDPPRRRTMAYSAPPASGDSGDDDYPEIMVLGHDADDHTSIHMIPALEISAELLDVIQDIVEPRRASERPHHLAPPPVPTDDDE